ncbi:hypothetical protein BKA64DRAFT_720175 [Cadophora sp. MPI-SDFR-AT-0126]|nr:hypothetical protein BKA64DRAFT_720175 [Leotiomycetes sp. MPI-SDFR-AT-0126]
MSSQLGTRVCRAEMELEEIIVSVTSNHPVIHQPSNHDYSRTPATLEQISRQTFILNSARQLQDPQSDRYGEADDHERQLHSHSLQSNPGDHAATSTETAGTPSSQGHHFETPSIRTPDLSTPSTTQSSSPPSSQLSPTSSQARSPILARQAPCLLHRAPLTSPNSSTSASSPISLPNNKFGCPLCPRDHFSSRTRALYSSLLYVLVPIPSSPTFFQSPTLLHAQTNETPLSNHILYYAHTHSCRRPSCNWTYDTAKDLRRHLKSHLANRPRYQCPIQNCKAQRKSKVKGFSRRDGLEKHLRIYHKDERTGVVDDDVEMGRVDDVEGADTEVEVELEMEVEE